MRKQAKQIRSNIEKYFGATVEGFATYRYYKGNDTLRAWITTPLTVDIFERKQGTIAALFSPRLWTEDGLASLAGNKTFWDRSTLYGLRGVFAAGETEKALDISSLLFQDEDCWVSMCLMRWKHIPKATSGIFLQRVVCIAAFIPKECLACGPSVLIVLIAHPAYQQHGMKWHCAIFIHLEIYLISK